MSIKAIIVDDEKAGREILSVLVKKYCPEIEVATMAENISQAEQLIREIKPDLVFLDIEMPNGNGFELLQRLKPINFSVIFVTAYDHYAMKAIRVSALDYLLKPVDADDLVEAVSKFRKNEVKKLQSEQIEILLGNIKQRKLKSIAVPDAEGLNFISIDNIIRCESDGNYTCIITSDGKKVVSSKTLGDYDTMLDGEGFFRVHRSHLINTKFIKKYIRGEGGSVIMTDGAEVEVSRRKKPEFLDYVAGKGQE